MKTFNSFWLALVAMCLCMNFASCSNDDVVAPEDPQEEKYVTVGLGCTGEFLEFSDSPLSRTTTEELYGIQVYALTPNGTYYPNGDAGEEEIYYEETPYAYGVFTFLEDLKIRLLEGKKYRFEVSIIVEPYKHEMVGEWGWYGHYDNNTEFNYSSSFILDLCGTMATQNCLKHDRFYGKLDEYTPQENGSVDINTKRVAYGVTYETTGLSDGESLTVEVDGLYTVDLNSVSNVGIYTFSSIKYAWEGNEVWNEINEEWGYENYTCEKNLAITWNKADGKVVPMGTYKVTFKRNVMTTIKIKAENLNMDNGIKVYKEEASMADDENIYEIEGGTVTEVPVIPGN